MIFAEVLALIGIAAALGVSISAFASFANKSSMLERTRRVRSEKMHNDLETALGSRDYRKLEDWIVLYAAEADPAVVSLVKTRRDELFIEKNP